MGLEGRPLVDAVRGAADRRWPTTSRTRRPKLLPALAEAAEPGQLDGLAVRFELAKQRVG